MPDPAPPSLVRAIVLAAVAGVVVDLVFLIAWVIAVVMVWATTATCTRVEVGGWSSVYTVLAVGIPLLAVIGAFTIPTWAARGYRWQGFGIGVIAALLPAWFLIGTLPMLWSVPVGSRTWCF